jgi:hypothetical protein
MALGLAAGGTTPPLYPVGSANPDYVAAGFIPEIWSGKLIEKFYAATVLAAITNTDYEGEIKSYGDRVRIRTKPTITINNYLIGGDLTLQRPVGGQTELTIDQGKYFATILDDVIEKQSDINNLSLWADDASEQMKIAVDQDVLNWMHSGFTGGNPWADTGNRGIAAGVISGNINLGVTGTPVGTVGRNPAVGQVEMIDLLLRLGQALDEQNIPETGRWVVMPTWAAFQIKRSELREVFLSGDQISILRNGRFGQVDRFTIYSSNLLPNGPLGSPGLAATEWVIFAGHAHGLTFASQLTNVETLRSERTFGQILRGLQVYGRMGLPGPNPTGANANVVALAEAVVVQAGP